ncbi:MAG: trigger factor [Faecalibacillus sp.]
MSKVLKLGNYKGITYSMTEVHVSAEEVEQQMQLILSQSTTTVEKEGDTVENGDITTINFIGLKDGVAFEGGTGNDYDLEIGSGTFIPGFEEQMIGMKLKETRDLHLTFPENYGVSDLAGQDVIFKVTVSKISVKKEPELNDEFVSTLGVPDLKTVADLKVFIENGLKQQHEQDAQMQAENQIFDALMADSDVELDDDDIDSALDRQMSYMANQMASQGIQFDQYLQMTGMDEATLREQMKPNAMQQAKLEALIDEIIRVENIVVTQDVLDEQLDMVAQANQMSKEEVLEKVDVEGFKRDLSRMQASQLVIQQAIQK